MQSVKLLIHQRSRKLNRVSIKRYSSFDLQLHMHRDTRGININSRRVSFMETVWSLNLSPLSSYLASTAERILRKNTHLLQPCCRHRVISWAHAVEQKQKDTCESRTRLGCCSHHHKARLAPNCSTSPRRLVSPSPITIRGPIAVGREGIVTSSVVQPSKGHA